MQENIQHWDHSVFYCSLDEAESTSFSVELGDLIVLATDGLFDNVSTEQILKELSQLEVCLCLCFFLQSILLPTKRPMYTRLTKFL